MQAKYESSDQALIYGRNPVLEALKANRPADCLLILQGDRSGSIGAILALCRQAKIPIKESTSQKLDTLTGHANHQGVVLQCAAHSYALLDDILAKAAEKNEPPFVIVCDRLEDPHNLGAIIRSAEAAGCHGLIVPKRHSAALSMAVARTAAGALEYLPVARVSNLASTLDQLKKQGFWIYGADMEGQAWCKVDYSGAVALVIGSEGSGLSRLCREKCDVIVSLPMQGEINSLNASVAAGILMYEVVRQRSHLA